VTSAARLSDAALLLTVWEEAGAVPAPAVGAVLLYRAGVVDDLPAALDLPLSTAGALLAGLHVAAFGSGVEAVTRCPTCAEDLEVCLPLDGLAALPSGPDRVVVPASGTEAALVVRCPTTRDLLAVAGAGDPATTLLMRCVTGVDGEPVDARALGPARRETVEAAAERLAGPAAAVLTSRCPRCDGPVRADVDIASLLWQRVRSEAPAVLAEVAELASAYGWSERDVLAMSPARRGAYLALAGIRT